MYTASSSQPGLDWQTPVNGNYGLKLGKGLKRTKPASPSRWNCALPLGQGVSDNWEIWTKPRARGLRFQREVCLPVQADQPGKPV